MSLYTELMSQGVNPMYFHEGLIKRFEPEEIRQTIQDLLCQPELVEMARALGEAGLAIYPESEDILAINALMAMLRKDWEQMLEYTQTLLTDYSF
jgi:phage pi2 protein 07